MQCDVCDFKKENEKRRISHMREEHEDKVVVIKCNWKLLREMSTNYSIMKENIYLT